MAMTFGSVFTGIGGGDLGLERAGFSCQWQVECDKRKKTILERHWPKAKRWDRIQEFDPSQVEIIVGGDPCPSRSKAKGDRKSTHPDLSGYFLAVVGRLKPRWVVRENVPAPDALDFALCLELLGYRTSALAFDSRDFTGQSRRRDYLCGCLDKRTSISFEWFVSKSSKYKRFSPTSSEEETAFSTCLTSHGNRMAAEDTYCFEPRRGLRLLSGEEAEALQGFPRGWTSGFPEQRRRAMLGEAMTVDVVEWIGRRIKEAENGN